MPPRAEDHGVGASAAWQCPRAPASGATRRAVTSTHARSSPSAADTCSNEYLLRAKPATRSHGTCRRCGASRRWRPGTERQTARDREAAAGTFRPEPMQAAPREAPTPAPSPLHTRCDGPTGYQPRHMDQVVANVHTCDADPAHARARQAVFTRASGSRQLRSVLLPTQQGHSASPHGNTGAPERIRTLSGQQVHRLAWRKEEHETAPAGPAPSAVPGLSRRPSTQYAHRSPPPPNR
jgi:hypothetical protein